MNVTSFYERYWQRPSEVDSEIGLEVEPRQRLLAAALRGVPPGSPVLDAGCGMGGFSAFLADLGFHVTGVDVSATAVAHAHNRHPGIRFQAAALEAGLPFRTDSFAAVWCSE